MQLYLSPLQNRSPTVVHLRGRGLEEQASTWRVSRGQPSKGCHRDSHRVVHTAEPRAWCLLEVCDLLPTNRPWWSLPCASLWGSPRRRGPSTGVPHLRQANSTSLNRAFLRANRGWGIIHAKAPTHRAVSKQEGGAVWLRHSRKDAPL